VTVDFDSLDDAAVTVRDRDSMEQARIPIAGLVGDLHRRLRSPA
jgi:glycyl-tRNA synthetase